MLGKSHTWSGGLTGLAAGIATHRGLEATATLAAFGAAFVNVPDLDTCQSSAARCLGFMSQAFAWIVHKISGGHRHGTHSAIGVAVFTGLAWLACYFRHDLAGRIGLAFFLAIAFAAGLRALRVGGHSADLLAIAAAGAVAWEGWGLALVPLACGLGCATHIAGDALTVEGVPLAWPFTWRHQFLLPPGMRFETGHVAERCVVDPLLIAAVAILAILAIDPALGGTAWHAAAHLIRRHS